MRDLLNTAGYRLIEAVDGEEGVKLAQSDRPDLILMDIQLPILDGYEATRRIRASVELKSIPIIAVTSYALSGDDAKARAAGCDSYVAKPFSPRELVARVRVVLRRVREAPVGDATLRAGDLELDPAARVARRAGRALALTNKEFRLLETLMRAPDHAFSRAALVEAAFGGEYESLERTVDVHVMNLRRKIEDDPAAPRFVRTVFGVGYRFASRPDEE